jgi:hypothetical protein
MILSVTKYKLVNVINTIIIKSYQVVAKLGIFSTKNSYL